VGTDKPIFAQARYYLAGHPAASEGEVRRALRERFAYDNQPGLHASAGADFLSAAANVFGVLWAAASAWTLPRRLATFEARLDEAVAALRAEGRWAAGEAEPITAVDPPRAAGG